MKTYSQKPAEVTRQWYVLDAASAPFGRIATHAASLLLGKGKPTVTPHTDGGDFVIIINADSLQYSGNKDTKKMYRRYSGYPGGLYSRSLGEQKAQDSTKILHNAVQGMLPDNKLRQGRLDRLKIYPGAEHQHDAQKPQQLTVKGAK